MPFFKKKKKKRYDLTTKLLAVTQLAREHGANYHGKAK